MLHIITLLVKRKFKLEILAISEGSLCQHISFLNFLPKCQLDQISMFHFNGSKKKNIYTKHYEVNPILKEWNNHTGYLLFTNC